MLGQKHFKIAAVAAYMAIAPLPAKAVEVGETLPAIDLKHFAEKGEPLTNAALRGKVTLINFWATWCAACKVELLEMEDQFRPFLAEKDFQAAFVSLDKEPSQAAQWLQANVKEPQALLRQLYLDGKFAVAEKLKVDSFPMTLVVDRDGKVAVLNRGFKEGESSTADLAKKVKSLLAKRL